MLPTPRRAARVLLVDGAGRMLLFRGFDPGWPWTVRVLEPLTTEARPVADEVGSC